MEKKRVIALLSILTGLLVYLVVVPAFQETSCQPSFRKISPREINVYVGSKQFGIHAALIGCSGDLEGINPKEMLVLEEFIRGVLQEENWSIWPRSKDADFRNDLVKKMNSLLGRRAVSDIYLHSFSASESDI
jgi:hypothetical protein